jgi:hypothetical protein
MAKTLRTTKPVSAVFWGVYKVRPDGLELVSGIGRTREQGHPGGGTPTRLLALH